MKLPRATQYSPNEVQAAYAVLVELGELFKDLQDKMVIIGGFVPWLLLEGPPDHVGTLDVDLNLDIEAFADLQIQDIYARLEQAGYQANTQPQMPFRWKRNVPQQTKHSLSLPEIAVLVDLLMPQSASLNPVGVLPAIGTHLALRWNQTIELEGFVPDGSKHQVKWKVASLPALFGMKGHSLSKDRAKDAYDIYYVLRRYPGGPRAFAGACQALLEDDVAITAYKRIRDMFRSDDDLGAQLVGSFLLESDALGELTEEQVMQDAFQRVQLWVKALGITAN